MVPSPLNLSMLHGDGVPNYVPDDMRVIYQVEHKQGRTPDEPIWFEKAGPRNRIYFRPEDVRVGIVTCGGLCPGINNVIRSIVLGSKSSDHGRSACSVAMFASFMST